MHILKFGKDYTRRQFMNKSAQAGLSLGMLTSLWPEIARSGDISKVYPEELLSIEAYTKGKIKTGDIVDANNVDAVKDLLDDIAYKQVKDMGRKIRIVKTTTDVTRMFPHKYLEATLSNAGKAKLDSTGNVVIDNGDPWIGGNPFPDAKDGLQAFANITLSWGRHDQTLYAIKDWDISPSGSVSYQYDFAWCEQNTIGLLNNPDGPYWQGKKDRNRFQSVWFTSPNDVRGTSFLNEWYYDQAQFPDLFGYLPAFKRERRFPTNQRFEPLVPGVTIFLSDAWAAGDPMLTWGNYKVIETKPHLGAVSENWAGDDPNWEKPAHGGAGDQTFWLSNMELCPEVLVIECEPTGYPRAPVGKKRVYVDTRNMMFVAYLTYDRRGEMWKSFEPAFSLYETPNNKVMDGDHVHWSWGHFTCHDIQSNRMSRALKAKKITGGYESGFNQGDGIHDQFLTIQAIRRLGA